jgi:hypothetical protein
LCKVNNVFKKNIGIRYRAFWDSSWVLRGCALKQKKEPNFLLKLCTHKHVSTKVCHLQLLKLLGIWSCTSTIQ